MFKHPLFVMFLVYTISLICAAWMVARAWYIHRIRILKERIELHKLISPGAGGRPYLYNNPRRPTFLR